MNKKQKRVEEMLEQILRNQRDIMRWIGKDPNGYFKYRIEETGELLWR